MKIGEGEIGEYLERKETDESGNRGRLVNMERGGRLVMVGRRIWWVIKTREEEKEYDKEGGEGEVW